MIFLEVGNLSGLVFLIVLIMIGPPIVLAIIGAFLRKKHKQAANVFFILAVLYLLIGLGLCLGGS